MAGRSSRPDADLDDWFDEPEPLRSGREARQEARASNDDAPSAPEDEDNWLAGGDSPAGAGAGLGLLHTLSEWRVVIGLVTFAVLLVVGLAVAGVFDSGHPAATAPPTTASPATTPARTATNATTSTATPAPAPTTALKPGDTGPEVKTLQQALGSLGYSVGTVDGVYGPATQGAITRFQTASHLTADGVFGPATLAALASALSGR